MTATTGKTAMTVEVEGAPRGRSGRILAAIRSALGWPGRVRRARRPNALFAAMADHELRDVGLTRADFVDAAALPLGADPSEFLGRRAERRRGRHAASPGSGSERRIP